MTVRRAAAAVLLLTALAGCTDDGAGTEALPSAAPPSQTTPPTASSGPVELDTALRDELLLMLERDQGRRLAKAPGETQEIREARLAEIFAEHGWPGFDLVGRKAGTAAWAIAQHADLNPTFQEQALALLRDAVEAGQASPGNLAYLQDRVDVAQGRPQTYGTQTRCSPQGARPATPIDDPDGVDRRRAEAGLDPLVDYLAEMTDLCAKSE